MLIQEDNSQSESDASHLSASIIITSYNYALHLAQAVESALEQTYPTEVIIVDDASTDNSVEVIQTFGDRVVSEVFEQNRGQAAAMNAGVALSQADVLMFLDSDDWVSPMRTARVVRAFQEDPALDMLRHDVSHVTLDGSLIREAAYSFVPINNPKRDIILFGVTPGTTVGLAFRRRFLERIGPIPEECYPTTPDAYLLLAGAVAGSVGTLSEPLAFHRFHPAQASHQWKVDLGSARTLLELKCCQATYAQVLSSRFEGPPELASKSTWWQSKATYECAKQCGEKWFGAWLRHLRLVISGPLPTMRKILEFGRSAFLGLVPRRIFLRAWWRLHSGRPDLPMLDRFRSLRIVRQ